MSKKYRQQKESKSVWFMRIGMAVGVPAVFLIVMELALNLAGFGNPVSFFLKSTIQDREYYIENQKFTYRFFPKILARPCIPQALPVEKSKETVRIFVMGESAARGEPNTSFSFARILQALLEKKYPAARFEISNTAIAAINSHALLPIAQDCQPLSPDITIIYAGNNEVIGPYGPGTVFSDFDQNLDMIRFSLALRSFRIGQLIQGIVSGLAGQGSVPQGWAGLQMFLRHKIRKSDPKMASVYGSFHRNLKDMALAAANAGASTILCTVTSNLRDCAPFASLNREDLTGADKENWDRAYGNGIKAQTAEDWGAALDSYGEAERIDGTFAELLFRIAVCLEREGKLEEAVSYYKKAMEWDTLRFRADQTINETVRNVAGELQERNVYLSDIEKAFFAASPGRIPGQELFYEHVHMNFTGNYLIATSLLKNLDPILTGKGIMKGSDPVMTEAECRDRLVLTPWEEYGMYANMLTMIKTAPFTGQINNTETVKAYERKLRDLEAGIKEEGLEKTRELYRVQLKEHEKDTVLIENYGLLLSDAIGDPEKALAQFNKVLTILPHDFVARVNAGTSYSRMGMHSEALAAYQEALKYDSENPVIRINMGLTSFQLGKNEEALGYLEKALALSSASPDVHIQIAEVLLAMKKQDEAVSHISDALRLKPDSPDLYIKAGSIMSKAGNYGKAIEYFQKALETDRGSIEANKQLGMTYFAMNKMDMALFHFLKILKEHPEMIQIRRMAGQALENQGETEKALAEYRMAAAANPKETEALTRLTRLLMKKKKPAEAAKEIEKALKLGAAGSTELYLLLGQALQASGNLKGSLSAMDKAIEFHPDNLNLYNEIGLSIAKGGALRESLPYFEKALKLNPEYFEARNNIAFTYLKLDRPTEAILHYLLVLKARPEMADVRLVVGNLYLKIRDPQNAITHFTEYLKARPNDPKALKGLIEARKLEKGSQQKVAE